MKTLIVALALASVLVQPASAQDAGQMTLKDFRQRTEQVQTYMVLGAIALTSTLGIACPQAIPVGEWRAALAWRTADVQKPWIEILLELMDERGCKGAPVKADT